MSIALDAMGGDHAPREIIAGALQAAPFVHETLYLVGQPEAIDRCLPSPCPRNIAIHPASQAVEMGEAPLDSYRKKKDSSLRVSANLVKDGVCSAMVSAGNTGAAVAACQLTWRQVKGLHRPAIASLIPNLNGQFLLVDSGATPDASPEHVVEYAFMGRAYAKTVLGREEPTVHLLNIGEEEGKGNAFAKQTYKLLKRYPWFNGNIEGREMFSKICDVVVCDAFVGNVALKTCEGVADLIVRLVRNEIPEGRIAQIPYASVRKVMKPVRDRMDWAEVGGSPLLGLNGLCIIAHGRSDARAIKNAVLLAQRAVELDVLGVLRNSVEKEMQ